MLWFFSWLLPLFPSRTFLVFLIVCGGVLAALWELSRFLNDLLERGVGWRILSCTSWVLEKLRVSSTRGPDFSQWLLVEIADVIVTLSEQTSSPPHLERETGGRGAPPDVELEEPASESNPRRRSALAHAVALFAHFYFGSAVLRLRNVKVDVLLTSDVGWTWILDMATFELTTKTSTRGTHCHRREVVASVKLNSLSCNTGLPSLSRTADGGTEPPAGLSVSQGFEIEVAATPRSEFPYAENVSVRIDLPKVAGNVAHLLLLSDRLRRPPLPNFESSDAPPPRADSKINLVPITDVLKALTALRPRVACSLHDVSVALPAFGVSTAALPAQAYVSISMAKIDLAVDLGRMSGYGNGVGGDSRLTLGGLVLALAGTSLSAVRFAEIRETWVSIKVDALERSIELASGGNASVVEALDCIVDTSVLGPKIELNSQVFGHLDRIRASYAKRLERSTRGPTKTNSDNAMLGALPSATKCSLHVTIDTFVVSNVVTAEFAVQTTGTPSAHAKPTTRPVPLRIQFGPATAHVHVTNVEPSNTPKWLSGWTRWFALDGPAILSPQSALPGEGDTVEGLWGTATITLSALEVTTDGLARSSGPELVISGLECAVGRQYRTWKAAPQSESIRGLELLSTWVDFTMDQIAVSCPSPGQFERLSAAIASVLGPRSPRSTPDPADDEKIAMTYRLLFRRALVIVADESGLNRVWAELAGFTWVSGSRRHEPGRTFSGGSLGGAPYTVEKWVGVDEVYFGTSSEEPANNDVPRVNLSEFTTFARVTEPFMVEWRWDSSAHVTIGSVAQHRAQLELFISVTTFYAFVAPCLTFAKGMKHIIRRELPLDGVLHSDSRHSDVTSQVTVSTPKSPSSLDIQLPFVSVNVLLPEREHLRLEITSLHLARQRVEADVIALLLPQSDIELEEEQLVKISGFSLSMPESHIDLQIVAVVLTIPHDYHVS
ncbi:hypothetical protein M427DRAFT_38295 [Gonapodya prolifera JEL478]|uniref:Uncharacterized protein n=1 Tax=Gonapodya prolifera (strain JEL478) TaxID=1344416 RepID=A0A138ZZD5_GONPJ|nr:hypothetical protein M427DRAFT_38295 [Gonapodya prolifera JEL478]|eukprot:KXS09872.1 hypothetical protein M427DRAFT_38295 [Gonapodya prolifera JEL478]